KCLMEVSLPVNFAETDAVPGVPSGAFGDLVNLVGYQPVRLTVDASRRFGVGCFDEAEDFPCFLVDPVSLVLNAVLALLREIGLVRVCHVCRGGTVGQ